MTDKRLLSSFLSCIADRGRRRVRPRDDLWRIRLSTAARVNTAIDAQLAIACDVPAGVSSHNGACM